MALGPAASGWCFFSWRSGAAVCRRFPRVLPGSVTLRCMFSFVYCPLAPGKQFCVSVPQVPISPVLSCLPRLTAFKKESAVPINRCEQHLLSTWHHPLSRAASCQRAGTLFVMHTPHLHADSLSTSCPSGTGTWLGVGPKPREHMGSLAPSVCGRDGAFLNREQDSHIGRALQLSGLGPAF